MRQVLEEGHSDMVSMARPFLADPFFLTKAAAGQPEAINTCIACNQACLDHTFKGMTASCLVNPRACHETDISILPVDPGRKERIAVVGAGPAGLAFSTTAAERGHDVTLFDMADEIGGQFNMAKQVPGKEEFHETIRYFGAMLKKWGVDVALGKKVGVEEVRMDEN
jgi:2,4-dienoyl-CoA reductase (NADPH2)